MVARLLTGGVIAGFCAGLFAAALQFMLVQPVLLAAELYESGQATYVPGADAPRLAWVFDPMRDILTILFTAVVYTGYGLVLTAIMAVVSERTGMALDARRGIVWGVAGFVSLMLAPAIGLTPELPGVAAAEIGARQLWWTGCVLATALGCLTLALGRGWGALAIAVLLFAAPHVIGAPMPATVAGTAPPELAALFVTRVLGVGLAAWCVLGAMAGHLWGREVA